MFARALHPEASFDEGPPLLELRQGQRLGAARAEPAAPRRGRRAADHGQRGGRPRGHARRPAPRCSRRRPAPPACRYGSCSFPHPCSERDLRAAHGRRGGRRRRRRLHPRRLRRSVPARLRRYREERLAGSGLEPLFPALGPADARARRGHDRRRTARRLACVDTPRARSARSSAAISIARCSPSCRPMSIRAARTASSTPVCTTDRCFVQPLPLISRRAGHARSVRLDGLTLRLVLPRVRTRCLVSLAHRLPHRRDHRDAVPARGGRPRSSASPATRSRPPEARNKPRVSAFIHARYDKIEALEPDLILGFSDLQADIAAELIRRGYPVVVFNQRTIADILQMIRMLGGLVGCARRAPTRSPRRSKRDLDEIRAAGRALPRPAARVLRGMGSPADLGHPLGGGTGRGRRRRPGLSGARDRRPRQAAHRRSGRGRPAEPGRDRRLVVRQAGAERAIERRPGWDAITAVRDGHIYEIKSALILQPGPAALTDGVRELQAIMHAGCRGQSLLSVMP